MNNTNRRSFLKLLGIATGASVANAIPVAASVAASPVPEDVRAIMAKGLDITPLEMLRIREAVLIDHTLARDPNFTQWAVHYGEKLLFTAQYRPFQDALKAQRAGERMRKGR